MLSHLHQRKVARVVFDEYHGEAWSIRPEVARTMQPEHPDDSSYAGAATALAERDFDVAANADGPLTDDVLERADLLVIAHPSEPRWEHTVNDISPLLGVEEIAAIERFVTRGGGLIVLGDTEQGKYGNNLNDLMASFGLHFGNDTVFDYESFRDSPSWVLAEPSAGTAVPALLHLVDETCFYRAGTVSAEAPEAIVLRTGPSAQPPRAGLLAAVAHGDGRVVAVADSDLFGDDFFTHLDHRQLWLNIVYWAAAAAFRATPRPLASEAAADPAWLRLKDETNALRALQEAKGEVDLAQHDVSVVRGHVAAMAAAIAALGPRFAHQRAYLEQVPRDLQSWLDGGCVKPDFGASLELFRPELDRRDGIEHLIVFPMYTPNGSPDTRFEALIVRTPWPEFVAQLERERFDNAKFVPVQLVDNTDGYDSECAVLFPETVSLAARPTNNFGAIFCDRESARFRRTLLRGADELKMVLPPDAAALAESAGLALDTYILWDLIHDRWHSHGDLPFDPFMIRQRLPYWMYSLEELRVDLATYGSAADLSREGFAFARYIQYAILFDRILRFPITGTRVRNYDGLGGQLLFAFLHRRGVAIWSDNRLSIDWPRVEAAITELRELIEDLYRSGIDSSRVTYWMAAHDLVAGFVPANVNSQWAADSRVYSDEAEPRAWIDRALDDEFPLSTFYLTLQKKMLEAPATVPAGARAL